jgi:hypothetical protein
MKCYLYLAVFYYSTFVCASMGPFGPMQQTVPGSIQPSAQPERSPFIMTFFFRPIPYDPTRSAHQESSDADQVTIPSTINESMIMKSLLSNYLVYGIFVTYAGYFTYSDINGQVIFPRKNQNPRIKILVTKSIKPIFEPSIEMPTKTINHWEIIDPRQTKYYITELKQDPDIKLYFWNTQERPLPRKSHIPSDALIIFADPKHILVPTGPIKLGINTAHFLLPDIFVSPDINLALDALWFLKVKKYFGGIKDVYKFEKQGYLMHIV